MIAVPPGFADAGFGLFLAWAVPRGMRTWRWLRTPGEPAPDPEWLRMIKEQERYHANIARLGAIAQEKRTAKACLPGCPCTEARPYAGEMVLPPPRATSAGYATDDAAE